MCIVIWNGEEHPLISKGMNSGQVKEQFLLAHPGLRLQWLELFSMNGIELGPYAVVEDDEELVLRLRVIH
jgi:hypothetical protein